MELKMKIINLIEKVFWKNCQSLMEVIKIKNYLIYILLTSIKKKK